MITKLEITNWTGHEQKTVHFEKGKNLVYGENASGKSSIAKAIAFNLAGFLHKKSDPRRDDRTEAIVDLELSTPEGNYLIRRQINRGKITRKGTKVNHSLFIYESSNLAEALYTEEAAEEFLQNLLGLTDTTMERIIYMKEEDVHDFLANPGKGVLNEIDQMIGLEKAHETREIMSNILSELKIEKGILAKEIKEIDVAVRRNLGVKKKDTDIKKSRKRLKEIEKETQELLDLRGLKDNLNELQNKLEKICEEQNISSLNKLEEEIIQIQMKIKSEEETIKVELKKIDKETEKSAKARTKEITKRDKTEGQLGLKQDVIKLLADFKASGKITSCPTCGRDMDEKLFHETMSKLSKETAKLEKTISECNSQILNSEDDILKNRRESNKLFSKFEQFKQQKEHLSGIKTKAEGILQESKSIESLIKKFDGKKYPNTLAEIDKLLDKLDNEDKNSRAEISQAEGAQEVREEHLESLRAKEEDIKHREKLAKIIQNASLKTSEDLRDRYSAKVLNIAEDIWEKVKGEKWEIKWDRDFVPLAKSRDATRYLSAYEMSGSERFLILLAIRIAMLQTLDKFQLLIIDEPCQHLDDSNGVTIRDILTGIDSKEITQSIVFTFNQDYLEGDWTKTTKLTT